jgi:hypothetical protein
MRSNQLSYEPLRHPASAIGTPGSVTHNRSRSNPNSPPRHARIPEPTRTWNAIASYGGVKPPSRETRVGGFGDTRSPDIYFCVNDLRSFSLRLRSVPPHRVCPAKNPSCTHRVPHHDFLIGRLFRERARNSPACYGTPWRHRRTDGRGTSMNFTRDPRCWQRSRVGRGFQAQAIGDTRRLRPRLGPNCQLACGGVCQQEARRLDSITSGESVRWVNKSP